MAQDNLTHFDNSGSAHMVDVSEKKSTDRTAMAKGQIIMNESTLLLIQKGNSKKGDVIGIARVAGIMGAKQTANLIPLCHPLQLSKVSIKFDLINKPSSIAIEATVKNAGQTGVEMEALTAVTISALTIYDMLKAVDKNMEITGIHLSLKSGGKSGIFINEKKIK